MSEVKEKPAPAAAKEPERKLPTILPDALGLAEHKRRDWVADVKPDVLVEDVCDSNFWAHVADQLNQMDKIEVRWEDGSKIVHLRVIWAERTFAKVKMLSKEEYGPSEIAPPAGSTKYAIEWKGPANKHVVIRKSDNAVMSSGHRERAHAAQWIAEHEKV